MNLVEEKKRLRIYHRIIGVLIIVIGLAGLVLPVIPGWLLIFLGLEIIGIHLITTERIERAKAKIRRKNKEK